MTTSSAYDSAVKRFAETLSSAVPNRCICYALGQLTELERGPAGRPMPDQLPVATILAAWLSLRRIPMQIMAVDCMLCSCSVVQRSDSTHQLGLQLYEEESDPDEISELRVPCTYGQLRFQKGSMAVRGNTESSDLDGDPTKLHHLISQKDWPRTSTRLLPHDPEETIRGYLDWLAADNLETACKAMAAFEKTLVYGWSLVVPVMIKRHFPSTLLQLHADGREP
jgi:hypothetical protein